RVPPAGRLLPGHRHNSDTAGIAGTQRLGELHPGVAQVADDLIALRLFAFADPLHQIVERARHLRLAELAVRADAIDTLHEQSLVAGRRHRALQRLLEEDRHVEIAGAVHGEHRALDPAVELRDFFVPARWPAHLDIAALAARGGVERSGTEAEPVVDPVLEMRRVDRAVERRRAAGERGGAGREV